MYNDTICAIATAPSNSGISIIRVSGSDAVSVVDSIFVNPSYKHILPSMESHTISYGFLLDGNEIVDEVLVSYFKGPKSFTAEDTVEINCHGGVFVTNRILDLVIKSGARLAEPGEFTKRAFLNGRIDLSSAEAVMDIISSSSNMSLKSSISSLRGSVYKKIKELRDKIIYEIAFIESALDDPEHISLDGYPKKLDSVMHSVLNDVESLIKSCSGGRIIREGIRTVIVGKPNVGKSSLLNMLTGFDRAIVSDIEGTTRDIIEEKVTLGDINLCLVDTAGIRPTDNKIESIGVDRAKESLEMADLVIFVIDSSVPLDDNDKNIISMISDKKCIVLYNKSDLSPLVSLKEIEDLLPDKKIIKTSVTNDVGSLELENVIKDMFVLNEIDFNNEVIITNNRHKAALNETSAFLKNVIDSIANDMPEDFYSIDLMGAYASLGLIIGEEVSDDLVNEIFSKFCMGK